MNSQTHIENENYLEAIESIKEENGPTPDKWTEETLNRMALSQAKLHFYSSAYTYYMLANNKREALKVCEKIQPSAIEEHVKDHKHPDGEINFCIAITQMRDTTAIWCETEPAKRDYFPMEIDYGEFFKFNGKIFSKSLIKSSLP